jgi:hypothetical protein
MSKYLPLIQDVYGGTMQTATPVNGPVDKTGAYTSVVGVIR